MVMTLSDFKRIEKLNQNVVLRCRVCGAVMQERKPCPVDALHLLQPYRMNYTPYEKQKGVMHLRKLFLKHANYSW